jgi:DNA-binding transcriptional ArsR family regulator
MANEGTHLAPDEAFSALGNETRIEILRALGDAGDPLAFSALHDRIEMRDSAQFNYHLDKLVGHFVEKTDAGYALSRAGERIVEAVLSGAVTEAPVLEPTEIDAACYRCGSPIVVRYRESRLDVYCTGCRGTYGRSYRPDDTELDEEYGFLGGLPMPPAGLRGRSAEELFRAAWTWGNLEILSLATGICPRCSAPVDHDVDVCEDHDAGEELCADCGNRHAVYLLAACTNCVFDTAGEAVLRLAANTAFLDFVTDHGLNPVAPDDIAAIDRVHGEFEEEVLSTDPFEARFTFGLEGSELTLVLDDDLNVVETER